MVRLLVQFITILFVYLIGNRLATWLNFPIPGSIIGMGLLFLSLVLGICKLKWVERAAQMHIEHITLLFIPFAVGVWHYAGIFQAEGLKLAFILAVSSLFVLLITAVTADFFVNKRKGMGKHGNGNK